MAVKTRPSVPSSGITSALRNAVRSVCSTALGNALPATCESPRCSTRSGRSPRSTMSSAGRRAAVFAMVFSLRFLKDAGMLLAVSNVRQRSGGNSVQLSVTCGTAAPPSAFRRWGKMSCAAQQRPSIKAHHRAEHRLQRLFLVISLAFFVLLETMHDGFIEDAGDAAAAAMVDVRIVLARLGWFRIGHALDASLAAHAFV